jgi:hypothetical protein
LSIQALSPAIEVTENITIVPSKLIYSTQQAGIFPPLASIMNPKKFLPFLVLVGGIVLGMIIYSVFISSERQVQSRVEESSKNTWTVDVNGKARWFDTGIEIPQGTKLVIHATGSVTWAPPGGWNMTPTVGPDGTRPPLPQDKLVFPVPDAGCGSLVMSIGDVKYPVGSDANITVRQGGTIKLMVNDDNPADNTGSFTASITKVQL